MSTPGPTTQAMADAAWKRAYDAQKKKEASNKWPMLLLDFTLAFLAYLLIRKVLFKKIMSKEIKGGEVLLTSFLYAGAKVLQTWIKWQVA